MIAMEFFSDSGVKLSELRAVGGGSSSNIQCQIISDTLGVPVLRGQNNRHVGALGAAKLALVGLGENADILEYFPEEGMERFVPSAAAHEAYQRLFEQYKKSSEALFDVLSR